MTQNVNMSIFEGDPGSEMYMFVQIGFYEHSILRL